MKPTHHVNPQLIVAFDSCIKMVRSTLSKALKAEGYLLTPPDVTTLTLINENPGLSLQKLVSMTGKDKAQITRKVKELEKKVFLHRQKDTKDQRSYQLFLTEEGKQVQIKITAIKTQVYKQIFANLDMLEQKQMFDLMQKCLKP